MQVGEAFVAIRPDTQGFGQELQQGVGGSIKGVAAGLAAVVGAGEVVDFFRGAVNEASNLNEAVSLTGQTFGDAGVEVLAFGEDSATSFGLASSEALQFTNNIGGMFIGMGMSQDAAASLAQEVVGLGADLASAKNLSGGTTEALERLQAGIAGEVEPLRRLGVSFNAASVEARALADSGKSSAAALTEGDKAAARYAIILEQLGAQGVVGDFARTSDGLANQQRILNAEWQNAQAEIGARLLPAVVDMVGAFRDGIEVVTQFSESTSSSGTGVSVLATALSALSSAMSGAQGAVDGLTGGSVDLFGTLYQAIPGVGSLAAVTESAGRLFGDFEKEMGAVSEAGKGLDGDLDPAEQAIADVAAAADAARDELDALFGVEQSAAEGALNLRDGARDLLAQLAELGAGGYVPASESGDRFLSALQAQAEGIREQTLIVAENTGSYTEARASQREYETGLIRVARSAGVPEQAIRQLIRTFGSVPDRVLTQVTQRGAQDVTGRLDAMNTKARDIPSNVTINTDLQGEEAVISGLQAIYDQAIRAANAVGQTGGSLAGGGSYSGGGGSSGGRGAVRPSPLNESGRSAERAVTVKINAGTVIGDPDTFARELAPRVAAEIDTYERGY